MGDLRSAVMVMSHGNIPFIWEVIRATIVCVVIIHTVALTNITAT